MNHINNIKFPELKNYLQKPNDPTCKIIDSTRLMIEILWWINTSSYEFNLSDGWEKILLDWKYAMIFRYKRETDEIYYPSFIFSFDIDDYGNICIKQIQWTKQRKVAYRYSSSFDSIKYITDMIEENFSKNWVYVYVNRFQSGLEDAWNTCRAFWSYERLDKEIRLLNFKYDLQKNA